MEEMWRERDKRRRAEAKLQGREAYVTIWKGEWRGAYRLRSKLRNQGLTASVVGSVGSQNTSLVVPCDTANDARTMLGLT